MLGITEDSKAYRLYDPISKKVVISRDVIFEEDKSWNWAEVSGNASLENLEWGDDDKSVKSEEGGEGVFTDKGGIGSSSSAKTPKHSSPSLDEGRVRRCHAWMEDYTSGEELSGDEVVNNLAMFLCSDLTTEAIRDAKRRVAMDMEIESIAKNNTWKLTDLPSSLKKIGVKWILKTKLNSNGKVDKCKAWNQGL